MSEDKSENDYIINVDGIKLFRMIYHSTSGTTKAIVFLCHGLFEHCQACYYEPIIKHLNDIDCLVVTHDHMGHGLSNGDRGMIYDFDLLVRDVLSDIDDVVNKIQTKSQLPIFIYGHSLGGLISVYATLKRPTFFKGMCLEAPFLMFPTNVSNVTLYMGKIVSVLLPKMPLGSIDYNDISRDVEYLEHVRKDKLRIHSGIPAKTIIEIYNAVENLKGQMENVTTPFIIGHGEADKLSDVEGSKLLVKKSPITDKVFIPFPDAKHQIRMEPGNVSSDFVKQIVEWFRNKIGS